jgi:hypothetical protein
MLADKASSQAMYSGAPTVPLRGIGSVLKFLKPVFDIRSKGNSFMFKKAHLIQ